MAVYGVTANKILSGAAIFNLHDTHGLPFEVSAYMAKERGMVIDWKGFITSATSAGWKTEGLPERIMDACKDAGYDDDIMSTVGTQIDEAI